MGCWIKLGSSDKWEKVILLMYPNMIIGYTELNSSPSLIQTFACNKEPLVAASTIWEALQLNLMSFQTPPPPGVAVETPSKLGKGTH
jgi:hypothetical protein